VASGEGVWVQLYYANGVVTDENLLHSVTNVPIPIGDFLPGVFVGGDRYLPDITPAGGVGTFQVRAWSSGLGPTYEEALVNWCALPPDDHRLLGWSDVFTNDTADPGAVPDPEPPPPLTGLLGFSVDRRSQPCDFGPPAITQQPQSRTNETGTTAIFSVVAAGAEPFGFRWYQGSQPLADDGRVTGAAGANLVIANVRWSDAGDYSVVVSNSLGSVTSTVAILTVPFEAHEGFDYAVGAPLPGQNGGSGFSGAWSHRSGASSLYQVAAGSSTYPRLAFAGQRVTAPAGSEKAASRVFGSPLGSHGTTQYLSF